jgi:hypothetical protein
MEKFLGVPFRRFVVRMILSEMLEESFITDTINDHKLPIFIAYK